jgi:hypothetical protein
MNEIDLIEIFKTPTVVMTEELPFEEHLEGRRTTILIKCKEAFMRELIDDYSPFKSDDERIRIIGEAESLVQLFDNWWETEEADYIQIETNWKT